MNNFLLSTKRLIARHGMSMTYTKVAIGAYNVETGSASNTKTNYTVTMYPKQIQANQYNFPDLIGKELIQFYLANDNLSFSVKLNDEITYKGAVYKIIRYQEHVALESIVLYRITAVRS